MNKNKIQKDRVECNKEKNIKDIDEKIKVIDIILDMYPDLKKDKNDIINVVFGKMSKPNKYVFTKIIHNNEELYVDLDGLLLSKIVEFKGFVINNKFYMVSDINKDNDVIDMIDINKFNKIMYNNYK